MTRTESLNPARVARFDRQQALGQAPAGAAAPV